jgi:hypothetical protein
MTKYFHEELCNKNQMIFLLRIRIPEREKFIEAVSAYRRLIDACEVMFKAEHRPSGYFFERFDYDLMTVARALDFPDLADELQDEMDRQKKALDDRVNDFIETGATDNENKK